MPPQRPEKLEKPNASAGKAAATGRRFPLCAAVCGGAVLLAVLCNVFVLRLAVVNGPSMQPTLANGDVVFVWRAGYRPAAGDIVVTTAQNPLGESLTKRVLATEGQRVRLEEGVLLVDGLAPAGIPAATLAQLAAVPFDVVVPQGQLFVLGDNPAQSTDSREIGCISVDCVMGRAVFRLWPPAGFGPLN